MTEYISDRRLRRQAPTYYLVLVAWPVYVFFLPFVWSVSKLLCVFYLLFAGAYLYNEMAQLMHECWHKYTPNINNNFFYNLYSYFLVTDPQIYRLVHGYHHSRVNTWDDTEFHPLGRINNVFLRRAYNFVEIVFGFIFILGLLMWVLPRHERYRGKYRKSGHILSIGAWILIYSSLGLVSAIVFDLTVSQIVLPYLINLWLCSFAIHHNQLIEHGGLIADGDIHQRNLATRNLKHDTVMQKTALFLTHNDPREHVLHHIMVKENSRPFPGTIPMPENAVYISLGDYGRILRDMITKG